MDNTCTFVQMGKPVLEKSEQRNGKETTSHDAAAAIALLLPSPWLIPFFVINNMTDIPGRCSLSDLFFYFFP